MAEILQEYTIVRRLLPPESIPWPQLVLTSAIEKVKQRYRFESVERQIDPIDVLLCNNGEFSSDKVVQAVQQLAFEPNVLYSKTTGGTDIAEALFNDITKFLRELDPSRKIGSEYKKMYQTIAVAKLSVPFSSIFSDKFNRYLEDTVQPTLSHSGAKADVSPYRLAFRVTFVTDEIPFLPRQLTIEPRGGSKLSDCIYYTQSPTDPETHRNLLEKFEESLS